MQASNVTAVPWFYDNTFGTPQIVAISLAGAIWVGFSAVALWYKTQDPEFSKLLRLARTVLMFAVFFLLEYITMGSRLDWMFNHKYKAYGSPEQDVMAWVSDAYFRAETSERVAQGCPEFVESSSKSLMDEACKFGFIPLSAEILSEDFAKFSVVLGMIIFFGQQCLAVAIEVGVHAASEQENNRFAGAAMGMIGGGVAFLVGIQQASVLLPLSNMSANELCVVVQTPTSPLQGVCLYKYAAAAIPIGLPTALVSALLLKGMSSREGEGNWLVALIYLLLVVCFLVSAALVLYWVFGGFVLGAWFRFALFLQTLTVSLPDLLAAMMLLVTPWIDALFC